MNNYNQYPNYFLPPPGYNPLHRGSLSSNPPPHFAHNVQQNPHYNGQNYSTPPPYPYPPRHPYPPPNSNYYNPRPRNHNPPSSSSQNSSGIRKGKSKKSKSLGHHTNTPTKLNYTKEDVERALKVEKENNKQDNISLMVRIPDPVINKEIVQKLHPAIKEVSFKQCSSNPRSCFVTLKDNADGDKVIDEVNKTEFGDGYLTAEYKKDPLKKKENDDLDPLRLFVGNLNYNVSRSDIVNLIPVHQRLDIGYSKQRQSTRYAKLVFHTADQAIEAFQNNCRRELRGKTLNVRYFRFTDEDDKKNNRGNGESRGDNKNKNFSNANHEKAGSSLTATDASYGKQTEYEYEDGSYPRDE